MRRLISFLAIIALCTVGASALEYNFTINSGLGNYGMGQLKDLNKETLAALPFRAKIVDDFPTFLNISGEGSITLKSGTRIGLVLGLATTGSRIAYSDYSGSYTDDIKATCISYGVRCEMTVFRITNALGLRAAIGAGTLFTDAKLEETMRIGNETESQSSTIESMSFYVQPEVKFAYEFGPMLEAGAYCAYLVDSRAKYQLDKHDTDIKSDWNGFRFGACFTLRLNRK